MAWPDVSRIHDITLYQGEASRTTDPYTQAILDEMATPCNPVGVVVQERDCLLEEKGLDDLLHDIPSVGPATRSQRTLGLIKSIQAFNHLHL